MALIKCKDCGAQVSHKAAQCMRCGRRVSLSEYSRAQDAEAYRWLAIALIGIVAAWGIFVGFVKLLELFGPAR